MAAAINDKRDNLAVLHGPKGSNFARFDFPDLRIARAFGAIPNLLQGQAIGGCRDANQRHGAKDGLIGCSSPHEFLLPRRTTFNPVSPDIKQRCAASLLAVRTYSRPCGAVDTKSRIISRAT